MIAVTKTTDWRLGGNGVPALLFEKVGFEPTGEEQAAILRCRKRFKLVVGGDQSGKSLEAEKDWLIHWMEDGIKHPGEELLYWLVAENYERTRPEFTYIKEDLEKLGFAVEASKRIDPGSIEVKAGKQTVLRIETKSGKDPRTLAMYAPHGIIICEASQVDLETYFKCLSRVTPKRGWLHLSGTYEGSLGWYPSLAAAWRHGDKDHQSFMLPSPSNWHLYPGGVNDPKILGLKAASSDAFFMERIMGIAAPPKGMVFSEFRPDIHIREVEYDPDLPVYIWEDPGYGHAHAIEVAQIARIREGEQIRVVDEIYEQGIITEELIQACTTKPWWKNPNKIIVIDPHYSDQHHSTHSIAEIWRAKASMTPMEMPKLRISEGTERFKSFLKVNPLTGEPGIVFAPSCKGVLSEVGAYPNPFDGQTKVYSWKMDREGNVLGDEPDDRWNDGCKAIIYGIVQRFGLSSSGNATEFLMGRYLANADRKALAKRRHQRVYSGAKRF